MTKTLVLIALMLSVMALCAYSKDSPSPKELRITLPGTQKEIAIGMTLDQIKAVLPEVEFEKVYDISGLALYRSTPKTKIGSYMLIPNFKNDKLFLVGFGYGSPQKDSLNVADKLHLWFHANADTLPKAGHTIKVEKGDTIETWQSGALEWRSEITTDKELKDTTRIYYVILKGKN